MSTYERASNAGQVVSIKRVTATLPPRLLIHGQEGVGKTTLAAKFPAPIFLQTEDGIPVGIEADTFGLLTSFSDVRYGIDGARD